MGADLWVDSRRLASAYGDARAATLLGSQAEFQARFTHRCRGGVWHSRGLEWPIAANPPGGVAERTAPSAWRWMRWERVYHSLWMPVDSPSSVHLEQVYIPEADPAPT